MQFSFTHVYFLLLRSIRYYVRCNLREHLNVPNFAYVSTKIEIHLYRNTIAHSVL